MDKEEMKNMVVLKNLPSNIIDEAIVILKPNIKFKSLDLTENKISYNKQGKQDINNKRYIIDEAEMVISNYIYNMEKKKQNIIQLDKRMAMKYKRLKILSIFLALMLCIIFLIK